MNSKDRKLLEFYIKSQINEKFGKKLGTAAALATTLGLSSPDMAQAEERPAITKQSTRLSPEELKPLILKAAKKYDVDPALIDAIIQTESAYKPRAVSPVGAKGLMQLMPSTAKGVGVSDPFDPEQSIMGGTKFLAWLLRIFDGNLEKAVAAYNAGPQNVKKYDGIPPFKETQHYVKKVLSRTTSSMFRQNY